MRRRDGARGRPGLLTLDPADNTVDPTNVRRAGFSRSAGETDPGRAAGQAGRPAGLFRPCAGLTLIALASEEQSGQASQRGTESRNRPSDTSIGLAPAWSTISMSRNREAI